MYPKYKCLGCGNIWWSREILIICPVCRGKGIKIKDGVDIKEVVKKLKAVILLTGFLPPNEIARAMIVIGKAKANLSISRMIILGILAGAFIGFGSELAIMVTYDMPKYLGVGFTKFIFGSVFSVGLMLVIIAGAELFTGNNLILIKVLNREGDLRKMFKSWFWVYIANFLGFYYWFGLCLEPDFGKWVILQ